MNMNKIVGSILCICILTLSLAAQQPFAPAAAAPTAVPRLVKFNGAVTDATLIKAGEVGITFALYQDENGGAPLWIESQNVRLDERGRFTVQLGASKAQGVPVDLFASGEARWLGVRPDGLPEQPRVLLVSVPYALKAADADTVGGHPASAFVLAPTPDDRLSGSADSAITPPAAITGAGTANFVPLWTSASDLGNSALFQSGAGATAKLGINTVTPTSTLDVKGGATIRGGFTLPAAGSAIAAAGKNSQSQTFAASAFNSSTSTSVNQLFRLQVEPAANNTPTPSGTLNLLFGQGSVTPAETGFKISGNGQITFAPGQSFPGTGPGTVKSVAFAAPASDFNVSGSPITSTGTLGFTWKLPPTDAGTANAIVKRDSTSSFNANNITSTGTISTTTTNGVGLRANATATTGQTIAVYGITASGSNNATGVLGLATATDGLFTLGVVGVSNSPQGVGVLGYGDSAFTGVGQIYQGEHSGVWGDSANVAVRATSDEGVGVFAVNNSHSTPTVFVENRGAGNLFEATAPNNNSARCAIDNHADLTCTGFVRGGAPDDATYALIAENNSTGVPTLFVENDAASGTGLVFKGQGPSGQNCRIDNAGDLACSGNITAQAGESRIDHPLDPANKYLNHAAIESSEALHLYTGNVQLDAQGAASVQLPSWFDAINTDFRYQLTSVGAPGPGLYVAQKMQNNVFRIAGGAPNAEVSWQVTCLRSDPYAKAHPLLVEEAKPEADLGYYEDPELYGQPAEEGVFSPEHSPRPKSASEKR